MSILKRSMLMSKRILGLGYAFGLMLLASICCADAVNNQVNHLNNLNNEDIQFFLRIQHAIASEDKQWLARNVFYPLGVNSSSKLNHRIHRTVHNKNEFITNYKAIINKKVELAVKNQNPQHLFKNWEGVMIGNGEIWFQKLGPINKRGELEIEQYRYYIFTINN